MNGRADEHVALFNRCQKAGKWDDSVVTFSEDAEMTFVDVSTQSSTTRIGDRPCTGGLAENDWAQTIS